MCTVTFIPFKDRILLTSNRDEQAARRAAILPEAHEFASGKMLYPRDGKANGTWVAMHENGNAMVLLNGAFEKHVHRTDYRKSRGLIFLQVFNAAQPVSEFEKIDLDNIEPFTLVIWQQRSLWEARWDGKEKYIMPKPNNIPQMWSSVTLYDKEVVEKRKQWFAEWLEGRQYIRMEDVLQFHEFGGNEDPRNALRMNRDGILLTLSITGIQIKQERGCMHYKDLVAGLTAINEWHFLNHHV